MSIRSHQTITLRPARLFIFNFPSLTCGISLSYLRNIKDLSKRTSLYFHVLSIVPHTHSEMVQFAALSESELVSKPRARSIIYKAFRESISPSCLGCSYYFGMSYRSRGHRLQNQQNRLNPTDSTSSGSTSSGPGAARARDMLTMLRSAEPNSVQIRSLVIGTG